MPRRMTADKPKGDKHINKMMAFRPPAEIRRRVVAVATQERRSVSQVVEILVEEALAARDERDEE